MEKLSGLLVLDGADAISSAAERSCLQFLQALRGREVPLPAPVVSRRR